MCDEVAIVGVGCRFPGADNPEGFWRVLVEGENHVREVDNERWNFYDYYDPDIHAEGKTAVNRAGLLKNIDEWDNEFFGVSDNEAKVVDPQQRLVLECCHMAMEDAGITRKQLDGSQTSVYVGAMNDDFKARKNIFTAADSAYSVTGIFRSILSARVSYTFNLKGPCMVVDTACSSSLVAIHLACQSLKTNESSMAFAGGVSVLLDPSPFVPLSKARMLSPTGQCQTFSSDANGYARGEGCGMVILQRLEDALREGNTIWGVIKTGTNQDGRMVTPMNAPSGVQQLELLQRVYKENEADRNNVQVIEAHGTGTPIGDPTEVNALGEFFKDSETAKTHNIVIGSVKTNIGHLESAAGVAGLIKVILMMKHGQIVPSLMYSEEKRNPKLDFKSFNFVVPTDEMKWPLNNNNKTRVACVNSFGFGGSNAHLFIEQYVPQTKTNGKNGHLGTGEQKLFAVSSFDRPGLVKNLKQFRDDLEESSSGLQEIVLTSLCRRDHFKYRAAMIASSKDELQKQCLATIRRIENQKPPGSLRFVYVFCGVGTTWKGMCHELLHNKIFKAAVIPIDKRLQEYTGWSIIEKWANKEDVVSDPFVSHLSIFVCQVGLTAIWKAVGIIPDAVIGQSVGEVAACLASGVIDEDVAVKIIYHRSLLLSQCKSGGMIVVRNVEVNTVKQMCQEIGDINIAVYISPVACTVSGEKAAIKRLEIALQEKQNVRTKTLDVSCGYHSPMVAAAGDELQTSLGEYANCENGKRYIPVVSTVYGKEIGHDKLSTSSYWKDNVNNPVKFHHAIVQAAISNEHTVFVEIGPSPVLQAHSLDIFGENTNYTVVPSLVKGKEYATMLQGLATVYELGSKMHFDVILDNYTEVKPSLIPRYVFNKKSFPVPKEYEFEHGSTKRNQRKQTHKYVFLKDESNMEDFMEIEISPETTPYVYQHFVRDNNIVPGAMYVDVGFEIGKMLLHLQPYHMTVTLDFIKAVPVNEGETLLMKVRVRESKHKDDKAISFRVDHNSETVCRGIVKEDEDVSRNQNDIALSSLNVGQAVSANDTYATLQDAGFRYGPQLQVLKDGKKNVNTSLLDFEIPDEVIMDLDHTHIHPCFIDGMLQSTVVFTMQEDSSTEPVQFIPVGMDSVRITKNFADISQKSTLKLLTEKVNETSLETMRKQHFNIYLTDEHGLILVEMRNFTMYATNRQMKCCDDVRYTITWRPSTDEYTHSDAGLPDGKVLVFNTNDSLSTYLNSSGQTVEYCDFDCVLSEDKTELDEKMSNCSTMLVVFNSNTNNLEDGRLVYDAVTRNFRFLHNLILYLMRQEEATPEVFLVTEGVHAEHYPSSYMKKTSVVGPEIWGFFRNIEVEFAYTKINVVDVASFSTDTLNTLRVLMSNKQPKGREFTICETDVYEVHIEASSKRYKMPKLRSHDRQYSSCPSNSTMCSTRSHVVDEPYLVFTHDCEEDLGWKGGPWTDFKVEQICIHDSNLYPATHVSRVGDFDIEEAQTKGEAEYKTIAIEMVGRTPHVTQSQVMGHTEATEDDDDLYVACFPTIVSSVMKIPTGCCIRLKDIPNYTPGLVNKTLLLWEILKTVPNNSAIYVQRTDLTGDTKTLMKALLSENKKNCTVHSDLEASEIKPDSNSGAVALVLTSTDGITAYDFLKRFELIVGLSHCLSNELKGKLAKRGGISTRMVDPKHFLESKQLAQKVWDIRSFLYNYKGSQSFYLRDLGNPLRTVKIPPQILSATAEEAPCKVKVTQDNLFDKMGTYIVVGGLTGVGWMIVELMAEMGAGIIVTFGRRACSTEMEKKLKHLEDTFKCKVVHYKVSVTNAAEVFSAIDDIRMKYRDCPIRGVFQGAGVINSATIEYLTDDRVHDVLMPKILGTINLHNATKHLQLDYFALLSSVSTVLGAVGQTSYGAGNYFLDAFADNRRQNGYKVQSINWGAISSGMAAAERVAKDLEARGHIHMKREEFRSCFIHSLMTDENKVIYANFDNEVLLKYFNAPEMVYHGKKLAFLWDYTYETGLDEQDQTKERFDVELLKGKDMNEQVDVVYDQLKHIFSAATATKFEEDDFKEPLVAMGIDSMATITLISLIRSHFGVTFKAEVMLEQSSTIQKLATKIVFDMNMEE